MKSFFGFSVRIYFSRSQRWGLIVLLFAIIVIQMLFFVSDIIVDEHNSNKFVEDREMQLKLDSIRVALDKLEKSKEFTFNPNFITEERAYFLEMSVEEYERLRVFREEGKFVNSAKDFKVVTGVTDGWILKFGRNFRFPTWVNSKKLEKASKQKNLYDSVREVDIKKVDINGASKEKLMEVRGIGEVLSERILKEREKFGAFVSTEQFGFIWGISPEVVLEMEKHFLVKNTELSKKIDVNRADRNELKAIPYLNYSIALEIIKHRSMNGDLKSIEDLKEIKNIPLDKLGIINLYLDF